jgi:ferredoxin
MANLPDREEVQIPQSSEDLDLRLLEKKPETKSDKEWSGVIHNFHMTGSQTDLEEAMLLGSPLVPALLVQLEKDGKLEQQYPFYLPKPGSEGAKAQPLVRLLKDSLNQCEQKGEELRILKDNLPVVTDFLNRPANSEIEQLTPEVFAEVKNVFDLSATGAATLQKELDLLQSELTGEGRLIRLGSATLLNLFSWVCSQEYQSYRLKLLKEVKRASNGLDALLLVDQRKSAEGRSPEFLAAVIGEQGNALLDSAALSRSIPGQDGSLSLSTERRERIEKARDLLSAFLSDSDLAPLFYLVHSEPLGGSEESPASASIHHPDSFSAALELVQDLMATMVEVFKALRVAHLEIAGDYEPELHDLLLERFDWQSCEADELLAITPVVIWESAEKVYQSGLSSLSRVLRSGLPLKVLIPSPNLTSEKELSGFLPDLGHLLVVHRETLVIQSSLVQPSRLVDGLRRISESLRPAVAVVAGPTGQTDPEWSWPESVIANLSRSAPAFVYDPDAGSSWAECFTLEDIPDQEEPWLTVNWPYTSSDGSEGSREEALTFAHAAALQGSYRKHFLTIPEEAWSDEQIEVGAYLSSYQDEPPKAIPFIWILGPDQVPQRAVVTRELVNASRDRQRSWRIVQELAGINNEYVRRAVEKTRREVESSAKAEIEAIGERERSEGAAQAIDRLVAVFTNPAALAAIPTVPLSISVESAEQLPDEEEPEEMAAPVEAAVEEKEEFSAEPYIDTFLCTSCNDCINLNPLLFRYNAEKQAVIGDVSAGTFLELVKAAEACPARCIHPGSPPPNDVTATTDVIARAQAFQ